MKHRAFMRQIIFHRFYYRISMAKCDVRAVAKAALMLASKVAAHLEPEYGTTSIMFKTFALKMAQDKARILP